jgi:hypothetical protein
MGAFPSSTAVADMVTTIEGQAISIGVLNNDIFDDTLSGSPNPINVPNAALGAVAVLTLTQPAAAQGTVASVPGVTNINVPTVLFKPKPGFAGTAAFSYSFGVGGVISNSVVVSIAVNSLHIPSSTAVADSDTTIAGQAFSIGVLDNDIFDDDVNGSPNPRLVPAATLGAVAVLTLTQPAAAQGRVASVPGDANVNVPTVLYTPKDGFTGTATFNYYFDVGGVTSDSATVSIKVSDAPFPVVSKAIGTATAVGTIRNGLKKAQVIFDADAIIKCGT